MSSPAPRVSEASVHHAARAGDLERARALLGAGADPNRPEPRDAETALQAAIDACQAPDTRYAFVALLLTRGASPTQVDADGTGPLFRALLQQDQRVLELLLRHGADPNGEVGFAGKGLLWWARSDYLYETYGRELPEALDEATWNDIDALVQHLDALAGRHGRPRPETLRLLRLYGARL